MSQENLTEKERETEDNSTGSSKGDGIEGLDVAGGPRAAKAETSENSAESASTEGENTTEEKVVEAVVEPVLTELEKAQKEILELKDLWTRERAEFQNYKKRAAQEQARVRLLAVADFVSHLLPALDNMESVLKAETSVPEVKNFVIGVEMIHKEFLEALKRGKISHVNSAEGPFDPLHMEAIASEVKEGLTEDTVLEVLQAGYHMEMEDGEKKVLRPARVKVGKPA